MSVQLETTSDSCEDRRQDRTKESKASWSSQANIKNIQGKGTGNGATMRTYDVRPDKQGKPTNKPTGTETWRLPSGLGSFGAATATNARTNGTGLNFLDRLSWYIALPRVGCRSLSFLFLFLPVDSTR